VPKSARQTPAQVAVLPTGLAAAIHDDTLKVRLFHADRFEICLVVELTRARVTQIMNLLHLTPDIQEELIFLLLIERGRDTLLERHLRPIMAESDWREQRRLWKSNRKQTEVQLV